MKNLLRGCAWGALIGAFFAVPLLFAQPFVPAGGPFPFFPAGTLITGNAVGTTGAVVGTLAATASKTTYICGFNASALGGTATIFPITVAGLVGSSQVYRGPTNVAAGILNIQQNFYPCIPASATNTAITVTTTANGTATNVDVNSWGYQL